jgi:hypothetical protein
MSGRLALRGLAQQLDERHHKPSQVAFEVVAIGVPPCLVGGANEGRLGPSTPSCAGVFLRCRALWGRG